MQLESFHNLFSYKASYGVAPLSQLGNAGPTRVAYSCLDARPKEVRAYLVLFVCRDALLHSCFDAFFPGRPHRQHLLPAFSAGEHPVWNQ